MIKIFVVAMTLVMVGFWGSVGILIYRLISKWNAKKRAGYTYRVA
ncbi:hypothetical protein [Sinorhizobium meliloti]|nr:hypothetical protein [Sinorhizobium meliloti]